MNAIIRVAILLLLTHVGFAQDSLYMKLEKTIKGQISPKSIVHNGNGLFFAQNMMYNHKVTIYNRDFELVASIKDEVSFIGQGYYFQIVNPDIAIDLQKKSRTRLSLNKKSLGKILTGDLND